MNRFVHWGVLLALAPTFAAAQVVEQSKKEIAEMRVERIEPATIRAESGFCYVAILRQGRPGDSETGAASGCVLMEDGRLLGPAGALHADIRAKGRGTYSHWTADALYFSASDNSDPRKNGRTYTLVSRFQGFRHTAVVTLSKTSASYNIQSPGKAAVNRRLVLRNLDSRVAVMPVLRTRGSPDLSSKEGMIRSILKPGMTPEQKSIAIWKFLVDWRYHYWPAREDAEIHDPVKFLNVYGYGFCDDAARNFAALCETAGLTARVWGLNGHVVAESFYDDAWHMFDPDMECYFRGPGGRVLGVEELGKDPSAITATPTTPTGYPTAWVAGLYTSTADNSVWPREDTKPVHRIDPVLQPGDELTFDLGPARLVHTIYAPNEPPPPRAANGTLTRTVKITAGEAGLLIPVKWPYIILGGELTLRLAGAAAPDVQISADGADWAPLATRAEGATLKADLTPWFVARKDARYGFSLRVRGTPREAKLTVLFQFAPRALPVIRPGTTTFDITLSPVEGVFPGDWKGIEVTHEWDQPHEAARRSPTAGGWRCGMPTYSWACSCGGSRLTSRGRCARPKRGRERRAGRAASRAGTVAGCMAGTDRGKQPKAGTGQRLIFSTFFKSAGGAN